MKTTQDKVLEVKRLMEEIVKETEEKANELVKESDGKGNLNTLARMLRINTEDYKTFLHNHWDNREDMLLLRLNQYDNKEKFKNLNEQLKK